MRICLFDPSIENHQQNPSSNLGDLIIGQAVTRELENVFGGAEVFRITTQQHPQWNHLLKVPRYDLRLVGGTNLLTANMKAYRQWKINSLQARFIRDVVLLGVGWWQYQEEPTDYTQGILTKVLSSKWIHSVRDGYTEKKLRGIGFSNVLNTGCPTMWPFAKMEANAIPARKSNVVLTMLTDYAPKPQEDKAMLELLAKHYDKVVFWPQGRGDQEYFKQLNARAESLDHSMASLEKFIASTPSFDYLGTRLHGGVHCLLKKKRSLIVEIDNRSKEIARETNLPTAARGDMAKLTHWVTNEVETKIRMNTDAIDQWRAQFAQLK